MKKLLIAFVGLLLLVTNTHAQRQDKGGGGTLVAGTYVANSVSSLSNLLINVGNNSTIIIQPGTYATTPFYHASSADYSPLSLFKEPFLINSKTNLVISGYGVKFTGPGTGTYFGLRDCNNVTLLGFEHKMVVGLGTELTNTYCGTIQTFGTNQNIYCKRLVIDGATDQGITTSRFIERLVVKDSRFYNIGQTGVTYVVSAVAYPYVDGTAISGLGSQSLIDGNYFENCYRCVEWDDVASQPQKWGMTVINNFITNCHHSAIFTYSGNQNQTLSDILIANNTIYGTTNGLQITSLSSPTNSMVGIGIDTGNGVSIVNNKIYHIWDNAIRLRSSAPIDNVLIQGNNIYGLTNVGINSRGLRIESTTGGSRYDMIRNVHVVGNNINNTASSGMFLSGCNVTVENNNLYNIGQQAGVTHYGFLLNDTPGVLASNIFIRNNFVSGGLKPSFPPYFIATGSAGTVKNLRLYRGNICDNCNTTGTPNDPTYNVANTASETYYDGRAGQATLVAGVATVSTVFVKANSRIFLSIGTRAGTAGIPYVFSVTANTSFVITNTVGTADTSTINWEINDEAP